MIQDADSQVYQVPDSVFTRPSATDTTSPDDSRKLQFDYVEEPFSFSIKRHENGEILFDTGAAQMIFETQYVRVSTKLPEKPALYGTGEHSDPL